MGSRTQRSRDTTSDTGTTSTGTKAPTGAQPKTAGRDAAASTLRRVEVGEGRVVGYAEYGDPGGEPMVVFHGTPGSSLLGGLLDAVASDRGVRLLVLSRPGYGPSTHWPGRTLADTGAFVAPVLADAGVDRARFVGFSGGGPHALAVGATHPELVDGVDLVASAAPPSLVENPPATTRLLGALARRTPRLLGGLLWAQTAVVNRRPPDAVLAQYTADPGAVPDAVGQVVKAEFLEAVGRQRSGVVLESRLLDESWDVSLAAVEPRVELWHGRRDENVPLAATKRLHDRLPDSDLTVFEDSDHLHTLLAWRDRSL
jgi:pimeloyl-ACP methyl ester carboxylesterase